MNQQLYAVYDNVAKALTGGVMVFSHDAPAIRVFVDALSEPSSILSKHPDDFALICLGEIAEPDTVDNATDLPAILAYGPRVVLTGTAWKANNEALAEANKK